MFGIPHIQRKVFKKNFLRSIIVNVIYDDPITITDFQDLIKLELINFFPRFVNKNDSSLSIEFLPDEKTPIVNIGEGIGGYQLISEDGSRNLSFDNTSIVLNVGGNTYNSFEDIQNVLVKIGELLPKMGVQKTKRVSMRKVNVAFFETNDPNTVFSDILQDSIAQRMIAAVPADGMFTQNMANLSFQDNGYRLNLSYGIPQIDYTKLPTIKGNIVEDIDVLYETVSSVDALVEQLGNINQTIFDVFSWITNNNFRTKILDE